MSALPPRRYSLLVYLEESSRPLVSLFFIFPILFLYEVGWRVINVGREIPIVNGADAILKEVLQRCGVYGSTLSAVVVLLTLFLFHLHRHDSWRFHITTLAGMIPESLLVAVPIFFLEKAVNTVLLMTAGFGPISDRAQKAIFSLGAGVYEEFLFRLVLLGLLFAVARQLEKKKQTLYWLGILISAILFSFFHHLGPHGDPWEMRLFAFRSIVGVYFAWIYTARGFGIAVGCHTAYNLMVILMDYIRSS